MKYKKIKEVQLESKEDLLINASAQCLLDLLYRRLVNSDIPEFLKNDNLDINYDFSLFGDDAIDEKNNKGYTNDKYTDAADSYVRRL